MSGNVAPGADALNADAEQVKTFRDFLMSYNKLSELCFNDCIWDFTSRAVKSQEDKCALNCMEKYLKMNQRISQRFQEFQIIANENAIAAAQNQVPFLDDKSRYFHKPSNIYCQKVLLESYL